MGGARSTTEEKRGQIRNSTCLNLAALMDPLLRGSKSWKCSDTLILLVCTCSCILATNSLTSTSSGEWWGDRGGGVWGTRGEGQQSNIFHVYLLRRMVGGGYL